MDKDNKPETTTTTNQEQNETTTNKENEDNDICSLQDVIDGEKASMDIADAVLGASDAKNCSYESGYVYRQALYSCMTCQKNSNDHQLAGVCLACSYACHANHELVELYTKRNFRCDCGNSKFSNDFKCKLEANKESTNELNKYNHNFKGLYCVCDRPYPPTEDDGEDECADDEMVQCSICEDWFHFKHLIGSKEFANTNDDFDELVCHLCMKENSWLWYYQGYTAVKLDKSEVDTNKEVDVLNESGSTDATAAAVVEAKSCFLEKMKNKYKNLTIPNEQACYFLNGWRDALCKCEACLKFYEANKVKFITNNEDAIKFYEEKGKSNQTDEIDESSLIQNELSKLSHVSKIEFLHNLNDFKQELKGFLSNFANNGEVVKRENVEEFFDNLNQRKKQKLENNQTEMSYYCK